MNMIGKVVTIGADWVRYGRYIKHHQYDGLLFRYVKIGNSKFLGRITSIVDQ
jgi:hypothetical protein